MASPPAIVIGIASITGLQSARLLAERGIRVIGLAGDPLHFAARTRACERLVKADVHGPGLVAALVSLGAELGERAVLVPCTDQAVLTVSEHRDELAAWFDVPLAAHGVLLDLTDKARFAAIAAGLGLAAPTTHVIRDRRDALRAARGLRYPAVLKPAVKTGAWKKSTSSKVLRVECAGDLVSTYERVHDSVDSFVAQEYVDGADDQLWTCNGYFGADGRPLVTFVTRKRRQWPPHLGIASFAAECRNDDVVEVATRLFRSTGFRGLGYVEVKHEPSTGRWLLIEANVGRPTGRSATAEAGGVELLLTMYCDAAGLPLPSARQQRYTGAAWIDVRRDLMAAVHYWRLGELKPGHWWRDMRTPKVHAVLSWSDPAPFLFEIGQSGRKASGRLLRRGLARLTARRTPQPFVAHRPATLRVSRLSDARDRSAHGAVGSSARSTAS